MIKELLQEKYKCMFTPQIIFRGRDYFTKGKVAELYKDQDTESYMAKVEGSDYGVSYDVQIILEDSNVKMSCTCPCIENCKHEYATLMAIDANKYTTIKLLPIPENEKININDFIDSIPEGKIKKYLKKSFAEEEYVNEEKFKKYFSCYLPEKSREYFYNTLFNNFQLDIVDINEFLDMARSSLENGKYKYTFIITSSIIDAAKESGYCDDEEIILNRYNKIGMFIRIAYRKGNDELKEEIQKWIQKYEEKNYYDDIFLEDMIIGIK